MVTIGNRLEELKKRQMRPPVPFQIVCQENQFTDKGQAVAQAVEEKHPGPGTMFLHVDSKINLRMGAVDLVAGFSNSTMRSEEKAARRRSR